MSAPLGVFFDLREMRAKALGTRHVIAMATARAVRIALEEGASYARAHHTHTRRTGRLTSTAELRGEMGQANDDGAFGYLVNSTPYARFVEYPTKAHIIRPKAAHGLNGPVQEGQSRRASGKGPHEHIVGRGIALRFRVGGQIRFARSVRHPGTPGFPFMRPASVVAGQIIERETELVTFARVRELWE